MALGGQLGRQNGVQVALGGQFEGQVGVQVALGGQLEGPSGAWRASKWRLGASWKAQAALKLHFKSLVSFKALGREWPAIEGMIVI